MSYRLTTLLCTLLLSACAVPSTSSQAPMMTHAHVAQDPVSAFEFKQDMTTMGYDYGSAAGSGDENRVTKVVADCYKTYGPDLGFSTYWKTLRMCMVEDYMAHRDYLDTTHAGHRGNPYFNSDAVLRRWVTYQTSAGFTSDADMYRYMRAGYSYAKPAAQYAFNTERATIFVPRGRRPGFAAGQQD